MAPFCCLLECDGNGFSAFDISCMNSWVLLNASVSGERNDFVVMVSFELEGGGGGGWKEEGRQLN